MEVDGGVDSNRTLSCCCCGARTKLISEVARIPNQTFAALTEGRGDHHINNVVEMLTIYANGLLGGSDKPINGLNPKFSKLIGTGQHGVLTMLMLGFMYSQNDNLFIPIPEDAAKREAKLRSVLEELQYRSIEVKRRAKLPIKPDATDFEEGIAGMLFMFGVDHVAPYLVRDHLKLTPTLESYMRLGCLPHYTDKDIKTAYEKQVEDDFGGRSVYLQALINVAIARNSVELNEFGTIEVSKDSIPQEDPRLERAFATFGLSKNDEVPDDVLLSVYQAMYSNNPMDVDSYRDALKTIADNRGSVTLNQFLENGTIPQADVIMTDAAPLDSDGSRLPCGLNNVGNTCYLNSLLQLYFSIPLLRQKVFACSPTTSTTVSELVNLEREAVKPETELDSTLRFTTLFSDLMRDMEKSKLIAVTPPRELVEIILKASTEELQFGVQQDVNECMDHVLGLLEAFCKESSSDDDKAFVKRLFFGTTRQVLQIPGTPPLRSRSDPNSKEEEFSSLIVDVQKDLYAALDHSFQSSYVEYNGKQALRMLSLSSAPPILTITLKRVQYSVETHSTFKSNLFMRFYEKIYVDRYSVENEAAVADKRVEEEKLVRELEALQQQRSLYNATPLKEALDALQEYPEDTEEFYETVFFITEEMDRKTEALAQVDSAIQHVQGGLDRLYEDFQKRPYYLHAVLFHQGEAQYGHYWIYMKDHGKDRWLKYNDSVVEVVADPENEIFGDTGETNTNPYCLVYLNEEQLRAFLPSQ
ncbi:ubiquitin-specific protease ubp2 [Phlyctochytrium planicorne]|nr:ubiquitin-specific protease ubp2 [Phlyctochytrium planicorne]